MAHLRLRDFRNYSRLDVDFLPGFHLLLGDNAQGKTSILEAIYLLATLRSFRGVGNAQLIRHEKSGFFIGAQVVTQGENNIKYYWSPKEKKLSLNDHAIHRLLDFWGTLKAVVFCSEDLQLIKGSARIRRRFLDLLITQSNSSYLATLQRYTLALKSRNALLRAYPLDERALDSFSSELILSGQQIMNARNQIVLNLAPFIHRAYQRISTQKEEVQIEYRPRVKQDFALELQQSRARERALKSTFVGPHRDDLELLLDLRPSAQFASEGQKRSLAIALKIAQAEYLTSTLGSPPLLLIDDVMGELDEHRRRGFLPLLGQTESGRGQVFMTCTEENWPRDLARHWHRWKVQSGTLTPCS